MNIQYLSSRTDQRILIAADMEWIYLSPCYGNMDYCRPDRCKLLKYENSR